MSIRVDNLLLHAPSERSSRRRAGKMRKRMTEREKLLKDTRHLSQHNNGDEEEGGMEITMELFSSLLHNSLHGAAFNMLTPTRSTVSKCEALR